MPRKKNSKEQTTVEMQIEREVKNDFDRIRKTALKIEELLSLKDSGGNKSVLYALRAVLVELANESDVQINTRGVAGNFYRVAAKQALDSDDGVVKTCLRHLHVLVNNPDLRTARKISTYWDWDGPFSERRDPFPDAQEPAQDSTPRPRKRSPKRTEIKADDPLHDLRERLAKLERVPENEAISFQLQTEIYRLEHETTIDEWPDVIREVDHAAN